MRIPLSEPVSPHYIHINPATNRVHLLVPVVSGQEISTDNTCHATTELKDFFDGGALRELNAYKSALEFDIGLLEEGNLQRVAKEERLAQIEAYIGAVSAMQQSYGDAMTAILARPSNLYSIQLRPREQDSQSRVVNPVFNINRGNDARGTPLSPLFNAMYALFPNVVIGAIDPKTRLIQAVLSVLPPSPTFQDIQRVLTEQCQTLFGITVDFNHHFKRINERVEKHPVDKAYIDGLMRYGGGTSPEEYVDALLHFCAENLWIQIPTPPFYKVSNIAEGLTLGEKRNAITERTERLSILTQFFLANMNVYCRAKGISIQNVGVILDKSPDLSNELTAIVYMALGAGVSVENSVCDFFNAHTAEFGLSRSLNRQDATAIQQKFERTYQTVTATKENSHMDDFMILDCEATGETAQFVTHQGAICVDFAEIIDPVAASANRDYFDAIRADFANHPIEIPQQNAGIAGVVDLEPEDLLARINDDQFEQLPEAIKTICRAHPGFQACQFLHDVAKGRQNEAEALLIANSASTQTLLRTPGIFTDYSGRTFNCTAYEYAYWAKDTHMCRMLELHMDDETKAEMAARIDEMERIDAATGQSVGLVYQQNGAEHRSAHFDFTPLKQAYQRYLDGYDVWHAAQRWAAIDAACLDVYKAQRDVPAHVAQEYCQSDRAFFPKPQFNEAILPRELTFFNSKTHQDDVWFPLTASHGLDCAYVLVRAHWPLVAWMSGRRIVTHCAADFEAISYLDTVRTEDLTILRQHLNPQALSHSTWV